MVKELFGSEEVPEYYVDSVRIGSGAYGFALELGVQGLQDTPNSEIPGIKRVAIVRMSPQHALILAKLLRQNVDAYQSKVGPILLPRALYESLGLEPEANP